jgi:RNA polymerase sigma factor (sigma-70 family)
VNEDARSAGEIKSMSGRSEAVVRSLGLLFNEGTQCGLTDADLLDRFLSRTGSEESTAHAFEALVFRHGSMVFEVCSRVLNDRHDAEDAFQATFLVLATRGRSIRRQKSVGSWLHGVALRVARRAQVDAARRRAHERRAAEMTSTAVAVELPGDDRDFRALHEEVERLPRKYREPVVLCHLEGLTLEEAAGQLGCPIGTLGVRLMRARQRLKARLNRRGVARADALLIAGRSAWSGPAVLPGSLVRSTVGSAVRLVSGGTVPLAVMQLSNGVLRSMAMVRLAKVCAGILVATVGLGSLGAALGRPGPQSQERPASRPTARVAESWIGKKAVIKYSAPLMEGDRVVGDNVFRVFTVQQVDGERVKLVSDDITGWIAAEEAVLVDEAIDFYTKVIQANDEHMAARVKRAQVRECLGERAKAIAELTEAIAIGPPSAVVYGIRGEMFHSDKEYDKAIADMTESIRLYPWAGTYVGRGQCWAGKGEYGKAIADYDESIRLDPNSGLSYLNRGLAWVHQEAHDKALADFTKAIELGSKHNGAAYRCRGIARMDKADRARERTVPESAINDLDEAIRLDPNDAKAYSQRTRALVWKEDYDRAIADADRAIQLDPKDHNTFVYRGCVWLERKQFARAIADLTEAIRLDSNDAVAYYHRGTARAGNKELDAVIADFSDSIRLDSEADAAYAARGRAWFDKGEYDKAIRDFDEAIRLDSRHPMARLYRGLARSVQKDYDVAIADFDEVIRLDPDQLAGVDHNAVYARLNRGWAWFKKRDY